MKEYTLRNAELEVGFVSIGASITKLINLKTGHNLVLGYKDLDEYKKNPNFFGCVVGRNAGRIENASFMLDGNTIHLSKNFLDKHQLHSGSHGFQYKDFKTSQKDNEIIFEAVSEDGEDGFPGNVHLKVTYRLIKNELHILYEATSDNKTILNFTNHSYFNLNKNKTETVENHSLKINASRYLQLDKEMIPKQASLVNDTPFDFRVDKLIRRDINEDHPQLKIASGYDHPFLINQDSELNQVATLSNSNEKLEVYSNQPAVVVYTGNFLDGTTNLRNNEQANFRSAICLETQGIPNSVHIEEFKTKNIYDKDELYIQKTTWVIK